MLVAEEISEQFEEYADLTVSSGSFLLIGLQFIIYYIVLCVLKWLKAYQNISHKIEVLLFWDATSRTFLEGYMSLSVGSLFIVVHFL